MTKHSLVVIGRAGLTFEAPIREFQVTRPPRHAAWMRIRHVPITES